MSAKYPITCLWCGTVHLSEHWNTKYCSPDCKQLGRKAVKARYKKTPKGVESAKRYVHSQAKKETDKRNNQKPEYKAAAVRRFMRQVRDNPYYLMRKRLGQTAPYRRLRDELIAAIGECERCGAKDDLTIDHVKSMMLGGTHDRENIQLLCRSCNVKKKQAEIRYGDLKSGTS